MHNFSDWIFFDIKPFYRHYHWDYRTIFKTIWAFVKCYYKCGFHFLLAVLQCQVDVVTWVTERPRPPRPAWACSAWACTQQSVNSRKSSQSLDLWKKSLSSWTARYISFQQFSKFSYSKSGVSNSNPLMGRISYQKCSAGRTLKENGCNS